VDEFFFEGRHNKRLLLLVNPRSRQGAETFGEVSTLLQEAGFEVVNTKEDVEENSFSELIKRFQQDINLVIVGGGDGSINGVLEDLVKIQIPLHVIPLGTANNLARTLNIPLDLKENVNALMRSRLDKIDLGMVNGLYFVNVAGIGLSARINKTVSSQAKKKLGVLAFIFNAFQHIRSMRPFRVEIVHSNEIHRSRCWQISVCNGRHYGSGLVASEDSTLDDGLLSCISTEMKKRWHGLFHILRFVRGRFDDTDDIHLIRAQNLEIRTSRPMEIDLDGDLKTHTPAQFTVKRKALAILRPPPTENQGSP
jgi:diacylglycerol kinase (ATP)